MNIHITWLTYMRTGPKYEYSYNLANLRQNWAQIKIVSGVCVFEVLQRGTSIKGGAQKRCVSMVNIHEFTQCVLIPPLTARALRVIEIRTTK